MKFRVAAVSFILAHALACATAKAPRYVAKVNGEEVTGDEVLQAFSRQHVAMDRILGQEGDVRKYVEKVVDRRLFLQEGYRLGLPDAPEIQQETKAFQDSKLFALIVQREIVDKSTPTEDEIRAAFSLLDREITARQMVVETREKAEELRAKVVAGEDFEILARIDSTAPSSRHGGLIKVRWGGEEQREKLLLAAEEGHLTPVFRSSVGWEFDRVEKIEKRETVDATAFEQARHRLEPIVKERKGRAREAEFRTEMWKKYDVKFGECPATAATLQKALEDKSIEPCAAWNGGRLTALQVAEKTDLVKLAQLPSDIASAEQRTLMEVLVQREVYRIEAESRGWAELPEIAQQVRVKREDLIEHKLLAEYVYRGVGATDEEARAYYDAHLDEFVVPEYFVLGHILVETPERAAELRTQISKGADFAELAKTDSKDAATAKAGGVVGPARREQLEGPLAPVVSLGEGDVSEPLQTEHGYHLVKMLKRSPARQLTWEESTADAKKQVISKKVGEIQAKWLTRLRDSGKIEVSDSGIKAYSAKRVADYKRDEEARAAKRAKKKAEAEASSGARQGAHGMGRKTFAPEQDGNKTPLSAAGPALDMPGAPASSISPAAPGAVDAGVLPLPVAPTAK